MQNRTLHKLNTMDSKIQWTSEPINQETAFLDLSINQNNGKIKTYHKPTAGFACYVPWSSSHPFHMKCNIAFNLFFRAIRINSDQEDLLSEITRIEIRLLSLGYPVKVIKTQREKALNHQTKTKNSQSQNWKSAKNKK